MDETATAPVLVVGVRFRPAGYIHSYDARGFPTLKVNQWVIVGTQRGREMGRVALAPKPIPAAQTPDPLESVERLAGEDDLREWAKLKVEERSALRLCQEKITQRQLPMKLVEAEYAFDGSRLTFYFFAEGRVDFRVLVRDLASAFHRRIELRQIGARDHAKALGGVGPCGKTLCCSSWLTEFGAVSIKMAKEQSLPLNPAKISGVCGRLMCCLAYENDQYIEARSQMPAMGEIVLTPSGQGRIIGLNVPRTSVDVLLESGAAITVPVPDLTRPGGSAMPFSHGGCSTSSGGCCSAKHTPSPTA